MAAFTSFLIFLCFIIMLLIRPSTAVKDILLVFTVVIVATNRSDNTSTFESQKFPCWFPVSGQLLHFKLNLTPKLEHNLANLSNCEAGLLAAFSHSFSKKVLASPSSNLLMIRWRSFRSCSCDICATCWEILPSSSVRFSRKDCCKLVLSRWS